MLPFCVISIFTISAPTVACMMGSEVKGAEGGGDALSLGENIQLNMDDAAKVKLS